MGEITFQYEETVKAEIVTDLIIEVIIGDVIHIRSAPAFGSSGDGAVIRIQTIIILGLHVFKN